MKFIKLTDSQTMATVDDEDFERINQFKWCIGTGNIQRTLPRIGRKYKKRSLASEVMNRVVMFDHIDRNPYNNQKNNLRECTVHQNNFNKSKLKGCSSKYKGVSWAKNVNKWWSHIMHHRQNINLGYYVDEIEAARAYNKKATELFREFANLNKDDNGNIL